MITAPSTWQEIIKDLQTAGYSYERIAIECQLHGVDYTRDAVKWLATGKGRDCKYHPGRVIMELHAKVTRTTISSE